MNLPLRDRRHQQAQKDLARLERQRDDMLDKLARIAAKLKATRRSIERYQRTPTLPAAKPAASVKVEQPVPPTTPAPAAIDLEIPGFLKRAGSIANMTPADIAAIAEIEADKAERTRVKKSVQAEKRKAKAAGETRKMPLSGREALAAIRQG